jgi:hypothetical protein
VDRNLVALIAGLALAIGWAMFSTGVLTMVLGSEPLPPVLRRLAAREGWPGEPVPRRPLRRAATLVFGLALSGVCVAIPMSALFNETIRLTEPERWIFVADLLFIAGWSSFLLYAYLRDRRRKAQEIRVG